MIEIEQYIVYTVKSVLRGHLWDKAKLVFFKTDDLLKEVQFR